NEVVNGTWEAIITPDERQELIDTIHLTQTGTRGRPTVYLFGGVLTCGRCGNPLHSNTGNNGSGRTWRCAKVPGNDHCGQLSVASAQLEQILTAAVLDVLDSRKLARMVAKASGKASAREAQQTIARLTKQLQQINDDYDDGKTSRSEYERRTARLNDKLVEA